MCPRCDLITELLDEQLHIHSQLIDDATTDRESDRAEAEFATMEWIRDLFDDLRAGRKITVRRDIF